MNIEDSIKILDKFITEHKLFNIKHSDGLEEAIETLLTAYEKEKEKNEELNKYIEDRAKIGKNIQTFINKDYVEQEYISKDKIKAKIEELIKEGNYRTVDNPNGRVHFQKEITDYQIEVLQSLLEKEGE